MLYTRRGRFFNFPVAVSQRARSTSKYIHEAHTGNNSPRGERNWTKSTSKLLLESSSKRPELKSTPSYIDEKYVKNFETSTLIAED
jgi:hypothetical protein